MSKELQESTVNREEAAEQLEQLAQDLRKEGAFDVNVDNRTIHLSPPANIGMQLEVREKTSRFRGDRESVTVKLDWKPE